MNCKICTKTMDHSFDAQVLHKYDARYFRCGRCGFLQVEHPHWLEEAYRSPINLSDTGLVMRNFSIAMKLATLAYLQLNPRSRFVDVAGGYGMLVRIMRDFGFQFLWSDAYCENFLARGFESGSEGPAADTVTAFEVLEHVEDPVRFIDENIQKNGASNLVFSTEVYHGPAAPHRSWDYYGFHHGQHISFYQEETLRQLAKRLGLHFQSMHGLHVFSKTRLRNSLAVAMLGGKLAPLCALLIRSRLGSLTLQDSKLGNG